MKKIIFVSHCILNTASKVVLYNQTDMDAEENLRKKFMHKAIDQEVQIIQLPCPEFTLYGPKRWGHVSNQFDNTFFRDHCRKTALRRTWSELDEPGSGSKMLYADLLCTGYDKVHRPGNRRSCERNSSCGDQSR